MDAGVWWGIMKESDHLEDLGVDARIILKWILNRYDGRTWTRLVWFSTEKWRSPVIRWMNLWCHKTQVISWLAKELPASQRKGPAVRSYLLGYCIMTRLGLLVEKQCELFFCLCSPDICKTLSVFLITVNQDEDRSKKQLMEPAETENPKCSEKCLYVTISTKNYHMDCFWFESGLSRVMRGERMPAWVRARPI
jgi:hypothetical protein